jgi:hypothetical protein
MRIARPATAIDPRHFGRRERPFQVSGEAPVRLGDDLRLFLSTFAAGFVVVTVLIA